MYYIDANIVKPLTMPLKLSYAELVGPQDAMWFVSHWWGCLVPNVGVSRRKSLENPETCNISQK